MILTQATRTSPFFKAMKYALAHLLILSCVLFAQDKPAVEAPKPATVEKPDESKPKIPSINIRDELIELIHKLKKQAAWDPHRASLIDPERAGAGAVMYDAELKARAEAQRLLLQALVELAKLPVDSPLHLHSSSAELKDAPFKRGSRDR